MVHIWDGVIVWQTWKTKDGKAEEWFCFDQNKNAGGKGSTIKEAFDDMIVSLQMKNEFYIKEYTENNERIEELKKKFEFKMKELEIKEELAKIKQEENDV